MEPTLEARPEQPYASIPVKATFREWGKVNALVPELFTWLGDTEPAGAPFYRYRVIGSSEEQFDLEVGLPLTASTKGTDRIRPGVRPAGTYAVLIHEGHPDGIAEAHLALVKWAEDNGIELAKTGDVWEALFESYLTKPEEEPDMNNWRAELAYLVRRAELEVPHDERGHPGVGGARRFRHEVGETPGPQVPRPDGADPRPGAARREQRLLTPQ